MNSLQLNARQLNVIEHLVSVHDEAESFGMSELHNVLEQVRDQDTETEREVTREEVLREIRFFGPCLDIAVNDRRAFLAGA